MFDIILVGGGPANLTAAIYGLRANKKVAMFEKLAVGGQQTLTFGIENYPGFKKIDGPELTEKMLEQALSLGLELIYEDVISYSLSGEVKSVFTHKNEYKAKTIILGLGASVKELNCENEKKFLGKGVSYCATCDGNFFRGKDVVIVGGGNTSLQDAIYLAGVCKKVFLIHRRDEFRGNEITVGKINELAKDKSHFELVLSSEVRKINGSEYVESVEVFNRKTEKTTTLKVEGLFIAVGRKPDTEPFQGVLDLDKKGYIITDQNMMTSIPGVFAVGDIRNTPLRQIVTACADGAIASTMANEYIYNINNEPEKAKIR